MVTNVVFTPLQKVELEMELTVGIGFIVMVKLCTCPVQFTALFRYCGVTVTVAVEITELEGFVATKEGMLPLPDASNPMETLLFAHWYEVPVPVKLTAEVLAL
jgi:hypothetical protein